jgi:hypothetical protein
MDCIKFKVEFPLLFDNLRVIIQQSMKTSYISTSNFFFEQVKMKYIDIKEKTVSLAQDVSR